MNLDHAASYQARVLHKKKHNSREHQSGRCTCETLRRYGYCFAGTQLPIGRLYSTLRPFAYGHAGVLPPMQARRIQKPPVLHWTTTQLSRLQDSLREPRPKFLYVQPALGISLWPLQCSPPCGSSELWSLRSSPPTSHAMEHRDNYYDNMSGPNRTPAQGEWSPPPPQFEEHDYIYMAQGSPHANSPPSPYSSMPRSPPPPLSPPLHAYQQSSPQEYQQGYFNSP